MPNGKNPNLCIRFAYRPRIRFERGWWRVGPVEVWEKLTRDEKQALTLAHEHANHLNNTAEAYDLRRLYYREVSAAKRKANRPQ